ncbi:hypothetical protein CFP56_004961, partial [Quercus suber]
MNQSFAVMLTTTPFSNEIQNNRCHEYTIEELITKSFNNVDIVLFSNQIGQMNMEKATSWAT